MDIEKARFNMIQQQIRPCNVVDDHVLDALQSTPREEFVPAEHAKEAFMDIAIPLPHGQKLLTPLDEARILQALAIQPDESVLEIGTGSGYMTALLAKLANKVTSVDIFADLSETAHAKLNDHGISNVTFKVGDACQGWDADGDFDVVVITGSLLELPTAFKSAVKKGGRLLGIFGEEPTMQVRLFKKLSDDAWQNQCLFETQAPRLVNAKAPEEFVF